jgi:Uma2 family endonuclease
MASMIARHAFTTDEWHRMGELGLFDEDARVELLDGEIIDMAPIGSRHAGTVNRLTRLLVGAVGSRAVVAIQNPVLLDKRSEPQPDVAVLAPRSDDYTLAHAEPAEILLLVEVADSTLGYDRDRKAPYYARAAVAECWVVDLTTDTVLVFRSPSPAGYQDVWRASPGDVISMTALSGVSVAVAEIFRGPS